MPGRPEEKTGKGTGTTETFSIPDPHTAVMLEADTVQNLNKLAGLLERMHLAEYLGYMSVPRKVLFINFIAGLARGLGFGLGMTVLLGVALYLLGRMVDLPLVGQYVAKFVAMVQDQIRELGPPGTQ